MEGGDNVVLRGEVGKLRKILGILREIWGIWGQNWGFEAKLTWIGEKLR